METFTLAFITILLAFYSSYIQEPPSQKRKSDSLYKNKKTDTVHYRKDKDRLNKKDTLLVPSKSENKTKTIPSEISGQIN